MTAGESARVAERLWREEKWLLRRLLPSLKHSSFFQRVVAVPPNRFRPPAKVGDSYFEHAQNLWLGKILSLHEQLQRLVRGEEDGREGREGGPTREDRVLKLWEELCRAVTCISDSTKSGASK